MISRSQKSGARSQKLLAFALITTCAVFAQNAFPLETLKITGNRKIPAEKIAAASGLKVGAKLTKADFDAARERLMATGAFENVGYIFKPSANNAGYDAVLDVAEVEEVYAYRFEDLPVPDQELRIALAKLNPFFSDKIPVSNHLLDKYIAAVQARVGPKIKVAASLNSDLPGPPMILFRPDTPRDRVAEVKFTGNHVLPAEPLVRALADSAVGTAFSETTIRALLDSSVRPLYEARGRLRATFPKIETRPSFLAEGVLVIVTVDEGPSYSLGEIEFTGIPAADLAQMQKLANLQTNDIADSGQIKSAVDRIEADYRARGQMRASAKVGRAVDDANRKVNLTLAFDPGPVFTMGKLEILGLDRSSEPEIRKMWQLKPGETFRPDYPDAFLDNIRKQQLFDNLGKTRSETAFIDQTRTVDVKLYFSATPRRPRQ